MRGARKGGPTIAHALREAEVDELDVASRVEQDVLGFEVAVGDALALVQELEGQHDLGDVELGDVLGEAALPA